MASGVPVVQPRRGAFTEIVERTGGGLLCEPDNANSLADGLYRLWQDATLRQKLARQGYESVRAQYTIQHSADCALEVFTGVIGARNP
jgi:glycosyltransferase involved in cell wall biosynthesis